VDKKGNPRRDATAGRTPRKTATQRPASDVLLDQWLDTKLRTAYSSVLDEPVPDDLIKLLKDRLRD
jgi:hypothetical protein